MASSVGVDVELTGADPDGCSAVCDTRPQCHNWATIRPPAAWTSPTAWAHPSTCDGFQMPGTAAKPRAAGEMKVPSDTINPAVARCA